MRLRAGALLLIASLLGVVYPSVLFADLGYDTKARFPDTATTTSTANPVSTTYTCGSSAKVFAIGLMVIGGTNRGGGAPTYNGITMTQANSTQKAATNPEASAEIWYLLYPPTGSAYTVSIPNSGGVGIKVHMVSFTGTSGYGVALDASNGCNNTSTNPTCSVTTTQNGDAILSQVSTGANSYGTATQNYTSLYIHDVGNYGTSAQYYLQASGFGSTAMSNTFGTSDDWGQVVAAFKEFPFTVTLTGVQASGLKAPCTGGPGECVYVGGGASLALDTKLVTASQGTLTVSPRVVLLPGQSATASRGTLTNTVDGFMMPSVSATASRGTLDVYSPPKDVYFAVSLKGTADDLKTGTPTVTITNGQGVFSEAQTGNIGQGVKVTHDTDKVCYISKVYSATTFDLITNLGAQCADTSGAKTVNSIKYVFSSLSDASTNLFAGSVLPNGTITSGNTYVNPNLVVYNNPGGTQQESIASSFSLWSGVTSWDGHARFNLYQPRGMPESLSSQSHGGVWDATNFYSLSLTGMFSYLYRGTIRGMQITSSISQIAGFTMDYKGGSPSAAISAKSPSIIEGNIIYSTSNTFSLDAIVKVRRGTTSGVDADELLFFRNNLVYTGGAAPVRASTAVFATNGNDAYFSNNTFHYVIRGIGNSGMNYWSNNNIFSNMTGTNNCNNTPSSPSLNNAYTTTSKSINCDTGSSYYSQTFTWQTDTFLLSSSDTGAKDKGRNSPESGTVAPYTTDFHNQTRPTDSWDIGWHEYLDYSPTPSTNYATGYTGNLTITDNHGRVNLTTATATTYPGNLTVNSVAEGPTVNLTTNLATASRGDLTVTKDDGEFVNLTTATATAYAGDLGVVGQRDESVSLATKLATGERGTLTVSGGSAVDLTTVAGTGQRGDLTVTAGADVTLVTKLATGERGTITVQSGADVPLTTVAGTGQRGNLNVTVDQTVPLTTVLATGERGTLDVSAGADVALTTVAGTGQRGDINPNVGTYVLLDTVAGTAQITSPTFSSSGDVTLATKLATGQRGTLTVTVDQTVPLTTVAGTGERGTLDVSGGASVALTTVNGTGQRGDLAVSGGASVDLTTVAGTGQRGDITATGESTADINLTTVAGTGQRGTLTVTSGAQVDLTTVAGTSARGTLDVSAGATVALSTVLGTGQRGDLTVDWLVPSQNVDLTTQVATSSYGIISVYGGSSVALTGETATGQRGDLTTEGTSGATVALTTVAGTGERGTITPSWYRDGNALLAGTEAPSLTGDIAPSGDAAIGLTGEVVVAYVNDIAVRRSSFRPWWPMPGGVVGTGGLVR